MKIGLIAAMKEEIQGVFTLLEKYQTETVSSYSSDKIQLQWHRGQMRSGSNRAEITALQSGIGKAQAAAHTTLLLELHKPDLLINIGSAAGLLETADYGDVVIASHAAYHDVDLTGFGYEYGQLPGQPRDFLCDPNLAEKASRASRQASFQTFLGQIVTGDSFVEHGSPVLQTLREHFPQAAALDMESAAVAHICSLYRCPCLIIRSISDFPARTGGKEDFRKYLALASANSTQLAEQFILSILQEDLSA